MLSETDIHYITGFLYVVSRREDVTVILGEKVQDVASESERDVDIVIAHVGDTGLLAAEVKDESRPLHVGLVEALCQKFNDMPSITRRHIVSASGFTEPALRKASFHSVECLTLVRGTLPPFRGIDFSRVTSSPVSYLIWREGPEVSLLPRRRLSDAQRQELRPESPVFHPPGSTPGPTTLKALADSITANTTATWKGPHHRSGPQYVTIDVEVDAAPTIQLSSGPLVVDEARVTGVVEWETDTIPYEKSCYLAKPDGQPFSGACLISLRTGLFGIALSTESPEVRLFHIPEKLRQVRPIRRTIFEPGTPAPS